MLRREVEEGACWVVVLNFFLLINISVDPLHIWGASQARHTGTNTPDQQVLCLMYIGF